MVSALDEQRPLLFLDVDGVLLPFGGEVTRGPQHDTEDWHLARLDLTIGPRLAALPCELVWATTWGPAANDVIGPRLKLPHLPVVTWPEASTAEEQENRWFGLHWKTRRVAEWAAGRPFVWVDDEISARDREWVADNHAGRALLLRIEPSVGLTVDDIDAIAGWLQAEP